MKPGQLVGISPQMETRDPGESWGDRALCLKSNSPDDWFGGPDGKASNVPATIARAKDICRQCPVIAQCLAYAIEHRESNGVWGNVDFSDPIERRRARSAVCKNGHLVNGDNARPNASGGVICRICDNVRRRETYARNVELKRRVELQRDQLDRIVAERLDGAA